MTSNFRYHTVSLLEVPLGYTCAQTHTHTYFTSFLILVMLFFRSLSTLYIVCVCSFYQLCHFQVCFYCLIFLLVMSPILLLFGDSSDFFFLTGCWIFLKVTLWIVYSFFFNLPLNSTGLLFSRQLGYLWIRLVLRRLF